MYMYMSDEYIIIAITYTLICCVVSVLQVHVSVQRVVVDVVVVDCGCVGDRATQGLTGTRATRAR